MRLAAQERAAGYKNKDFIEAKKDFVFEMLKWSGAMTAQPKKILDCGCGIGGTSRLLAKAFPDAEIVGITLSPSQVLTSPTPLLSHAGSLQGRVQGWRACPHAQPGCPTRGAPPAAARQLYLHLLTPPPLPCHRATVLA